MADQMSKIVLTKSQPVLYRVIWNTQVHSYNWQTFLKIWIWDGWLKQIKFLPQFMHNLLSMSRKEPVIPTRLFPVVYTKKIFLSLDCLYQNEHNHCCTATDDSPLLQCSLQRLKILLHFHTHQYDIWVRTDISIYHEYSM